MTDAPATRQAVITGFGVVSTHGSGIGPLWDAITAAQPAGRAWQPDDADKEYLAAALPEDYRAHPEIPRNLSFFLDRGSLIALDAALQAIASAGLGAGAGDARRFAVSDGLAYRAPGQATLFVPYGQLIARALGVRGPVTLSGGSEASGMAALVNAIRMVRDDQADVVIAGAGQALQAPILQHFRDHGVSTIGEPHPFDTRHDGFMPGEAGAYIVVEEEAAAIERGATILARPAGIAEIFDPTVEPLDVSEAAETGRAMQDALGNAGYVQNQVDLVVSCADGRQRVDFAEGFGLKRTFGRHAFFAGVTTGAATAGHTLAASGPLSIALALEAMQRQQSAPIAGFETYEEELELAYVREAKQEKIDCVLVTSMGMGGTNISLLLQKPV